MNNLNPKRGTTGSRPAGSGRRKAVTFLVGLGLLFAVLAARADSPFTEYQVKALFLFNFAKYVEWTPESFPTTNAPIVIGVLGEDHFNGDLAHVIEGKTIGGRAINLKQVTTDAEIISCQILFISASENSRLDELLKKTGSLPVLTVGENAQFLAKGGIINFTLKDGKVRLEINLDAARQAKISLSSKLLSVADSVKGKAN